MSFAEFFTGLFSRPCSSMTLPPSLCLCLSVSFFLSLTPIFHISKYKKAQQHKTKIIDEDGLFKMLRDSNPGGRGSSASSTPTAASAATGASKKVFFWEQTECKKKIETILSLVSTFLTLVRGTP